jgi:hypothetical protein
MPGATGRKCQLWGLNDPWRKGMSPQILVHDKYSWHRSATAIQDNMVEWSFDRDGRWEL